MNQTLTAERSAFGISKEQRQATHFARTLLEVCYKQMENDPKLRDLELYKQVLHKTYAYGDDDIDDILECAAEDSQNWVDDPGEALIFRDIVYHLLFRDPINFRRDPQIIVDIANIVEKSIPANI